MASHMRPNGLAASILNAAMATAKMLDAPHPNLWHPDDKADFLRLFSKIVAEKDRMDASCRWRLTRDSFSTPVSAFKFHVRLCGATALLAVAPPLEAVV